MEKPKSLWTQWLGGVLLISLLAMIVSLLFLREGHSGDAMFFLRWPFWVVMGFGVPLISIRLLLWRKARERNPPSTQDRG